MVKMKNMCYSDDAPKRLLTQAMLITCANVVSFLYGGEKTTRKATVEYYKKKQIQVITSIH